ncbi:MAG: SUMF1/EgtB/PvdO family nonheme iron enzyme, partial [Rubrivivax sp.]|nr:SUMF1/EgtB/PvdO family nonheme iron enzyme [Rubrivivax sp.]
AWSPTASSCASSKPAATPTPSGGRRATGAGSAAKASPTRRSGVTTAGAGTGAQWLRAAAGTPMQPDLKLGDSYAETAGPRAGNFDFRRWDPQPVGAPGPRSGFGVAGLYGSGWEWTASVFATALGFEPFAPYRGYSQDFFDSTHVLLEGGSPQTAACMMRPSFRNWFRPRRRHVHADFRCVGAAARSRSPPTAAGLIRSAPPRRSPGAGRAAARRPGRPSRG